MPPVPAPDRPRFAVILAGGSGRRLGDVDKPGLLVAGSTLLDTAIRAVAPALTVVVGPPRELPPGVRQTRESPAGGGPAAGLVAGLAALADALPAPDDLVAVLAADLPGISAEAIDELTGAMRTADRTGVVLADPDGRQQYLAGIWRWSALRAAAGSRESWHNGRLSDLLGPLIAGVVNANRTTTADIDTPDDLRRWGGSGRTHTCGHD
ncbi:Molybdopterin-guanine dinucleotide biosynthesis protein A [Nakamurella panacisegetis]|uniref:Molybdopterin-guanine dinucleotide biosynthesis protein A n=1 Tax=Nakamurella panacisegetis TaxID=1090615 RepID=A0A1H0SF27_9ACTN|nr:nucleotidyltransferase family protein [Nakamurella panacisegetis]SDP40285.1 Molybdopterin-guanine dinucleotide biosynthesis protein A [Nakamurella panacisegetis]